MSSQEHSSLQGKVAIITGASSGLGQATAILFARKGAKVTLCGRDPERLKAAMDECVQASGGHADRFIAVQGDLNESKVRDEIVERTVQKFGQLDVLVPNAGLTLPTNNFYKATEESFDLIFNTNVKSVFFLIQRAAPHLEKSRGNVVTVSSIYSQMAHPDSCVYPMSKVAIDHMTRCLALTLGPAGVRINAVNPSFIQTRIRRNHPGDMQEINRAHVEKENRKQPMGQCGTPEDVAEAIYFLASDSAKFLTGDIIMVDGGRHLAGPHDPRRRKD